MKGVQFLVDEAGTKTAVLIDLALYGDLLEDFFDIAVARERKDEEDIPWEVVEKEIEEDLAKEGTGGVVSRRDEVLSADTA